MNPYAKKVSVWTKERIAKLAADNRASRIKRYPETAQFGLVEYSEPKSAAVLQIRRKQ